MMRRIVFLAAAVFAVLPVSAQGVAGDVYYEEYPDPKPGDPAVWKAMIPGVAVGFGGADIRYPKSRPILSGLEKEWKVSAWKGEKVHTQIVLCTTVDLHNVTVEAGVLKGVRGTRGSMPAGMVGVGTVRYVLTDGLNARGSGCGVSPEVTSDVSLAADAIDPVNTVSVEARNVRSFWLSVEVPRDLPAGVYTGNVTVKAGGKSYRLPYTVEVSARVLPPPSEWGFYLDLWQNPYSVARYHDVPLWSDAHFALMRPYMEMLARAGQKNVTVSMIYDPWQGQTYDIYGSMIDWTKRRDGTWSYDYTVFDRWVGFMRSLGIDRLVNCYSMVPWNNRFYYHDEALGRDTVLVAKTGTPEFNGQWTPMLKDFAHHLREKGWFESTAIAMDERPLRDMQAVIELVRGIEPDFKISLAGNYHPEIEPYIFDYCIPSREHFPVSVMTEREARGQTATFYTCCAEGYPNTFTFSPPAESAWIGWHAAAKGYDGYLRWAYNCWPGDPLRDSRFGSLSAGDTYLVYPGPRSSIRFERLVEGIQDYEKVRILAEEFTREGRTEDLEALRGLLDTFEIANLRQIDASEMVNRAKEFIGKY